MILKRLLERVAVFTLYELSVYYLFYFFNSITSLNRGGNEFVLTSSV